MPYEGLPGGPVLETCGTLAQRHPRFNGEGLGMSNIPVAGSYEDISQFALCGYRDATGVPVGRISGTDALMEFFGIPQHRRSLALRLQHEIPNPSVIEALRRLDLPAGKTMLRVVDEG